MQYLIGWPLMPPLAFTQLKYALAMFAMSANDVPGWLVTIPPSGIGVPVAFTPGLLPHCDVLTDVPLGAGADAEPLVEELLLLHPAAISIPITATRAAARPPNRCSRISPPPGGEGMSLAPVRGRLVLVLSSPGAQDDDARTRASDAAATRVCDIYLVRSALICLGC